MSNDYYFQIFQTRAYTSTLFESYASPPVCEAREAETDEQDHLKHTILLILLAISMFTGKFLKNYIDICMYVPISILKIEIKSIECYNK